MTIGPFKDEYRWLSNFWESPTVISGHTWNTTEHFYQASKCESVDDFNAILELETPGQAKRAGARTKARSDWDVVKTSFMRVASFSKFSQNPELAKLLLETGDEEIVELNHWHDNFWGRCTCDVCVGNPEITGKNNLGLILMEVRAHLKNLQEEQDRIFYAKGTNTLF